LRTILAPTNTILPPRDSSGLLFGPGSLALNEFPRLSESLNLYVIPNIAKHRLSDPRAYA